MRNYDMYGRDEFAGYDNWKGRSPEDDAYPKRKRCIYCERELDEDGLCKECDTVYMECPSCGASIPADEAYCENCGWVEERDKNSR